MGCVAKYVGVAFLGAIAAIALLMLVATVAKAKNPCLGVVCPGGQVCLPSTGQCSPVVAPNLCLGKVCPPSSVCNPYTGRCVGLTPANVSA